MLQGTDSLRYTDPTPRGGPVPRAAYEGRGTRYQEQRTKPLVPSPVHVGFRGRCARPRAASDSEQGALRPSEREPRTRYEARRPGAGPRVRRTRDTAARSLRRAAYTVTSFSVSKGCETGTEVTGGFELRGRGWDERSMSCFSWFCLRYLSYFEKNFEKFCPKLRVTKIGNYETRRFVMVKK